MSSVEQLMFSDGERYPMLVDDEGMPDFWITLYITTIVRPIVGQNTINSYLSAIRHFLLWQHLKGRDVLSEFQKRKFLDDADAISLRDFCFIQTEAARRWHKKKNTAKVRRLLDDFPTVPRSLERVVGDTARTRYSRIVNFLDFTARAMLRQRPNVEQINKQIDEMTKILLANKPKGGKRSITFDPDDKAPPPEIFATFLEAVQFDSKNNPYLHNVTKKRNQLMFNLMDESGIRAGELLGLRLDDIDYRTNYTVKIVRRHDSSDDPRKLQPVAKTQEREIPIKPELCRQIREYIMNERADTENANKHPYLFITHHKGKYVGNPISTRGFEELLAVAVEKTASLAPTFDEEDLILEIKRHGFRHNFNYRLSQRFDEHNKKAKADPEMVPYNEKQQLHMRMHLNGWIDEKTAETYNLRAVKEQADKLMREDMEFQTNVIRKTKK